jgi:hypothetical protein
MRELLEIAKAVQDLAAQERWRFCFIGGLALQRWGEPRLTRDVDVTLLTGFGGEEKFVDVLLERFDPRRADAREFALTRRVVLVAHRGVGIDIALGALPYEETVVERASAFPFAPGYDLLTCSAEDLVVMKGLASRVQDWVDIEGIIIRQGSALDRPYIRRQLKPLAEVKEAPEIMDSLEKLFAKHGG